MKLMITNVLKAIARKSLAAFDLKLGRLTRYKSLICELEEKIAELENTRTKLDMVSTELEKSNSELQEIKIHMSPSLFSPQSSLVNYSDHTAHVVTQIFITDNNKQPGAMTRSYMASVRGAIPADNYTLYDNQMIEGFLSQHYPQEVLDAYRMLKPFAYKADLARLCILNVVGGWYLDAGVLWTGGRMEAKEGVELLVFRDIQKNSSTSWACSTGIIYAKPKHPALGIAIKQIIENCGNSLLLVKKSKPIKSGGGNQEGNYYIYLDKQ
jgi:mannosyltransferase OCH1-like enzyme